MHEYPECRVLGRWLQNELDVIETYRVALQRLHGKGDVASARHAMAEHAAYAVELRELLRALGRTDLSALALPHPCTKERYAMSTLEGDGAVVGALIEGEAKRLRAYEAARQRGDIAPLIAVLVERSLAAQKKRIARLALSASGPESTRRNAA